jgi:hypothetical protein
MTFKPISLKRQHLPKKEHPEIRENRKSGCEGFSLCIDQLISLAAFQGCSTTNNLGDFFGNGFLTSFVVRDTKIAQ